MKKYICENCNNEHDGTYGTGRFCSKSCRCSAAAKKVKSRKTALVGKHKFAPYGTWKCNKCDLIFETRAKLKIHNHEFHPIPKGKSWNSGLTKETDKRIVKYVNTCKTQSRYNPWNKGKHLSEEHKIKTSVSMKKFYIENPNRVPYILNHSSKESYPECFFRKAFTNELFPLFILNKYVEGYFLDFAFEDKHLYIEVDGEQHYTDNKIILHDKIRLEILNKTDWKCICRIRWSKFLKLTDQLKHAFLIGLKQKFKMPQ